MDQLDDPRSDLPVLHTVWTPLIPGSLGPVVCSSQSSPAYQTQYIINAAILDLSRGINS